MTQYESILKALRKAGSKGCTVRDLLQFSNAPWKRISEMEYWSVIRGRMMISRDYMDSPRGYIERHERQHNGRTIRVYVLKRVK